MTILDTIADYARVRVARDSAAAPLEAVRESALTIAYAQRDGAANDPCPGRDETPRGPLFGFGSALVKPDLAFIAEVKKASPSKGVIDPVFNFEQIALDYANAGADCISCLTEPKWFMGSDEIFARCRLNQWLPMIRKDFVIDEYQIYQAKLIGAQAVLLICSILDQPTITRYLAICDELGLDALAETHDEDEIRMADAAGARIIGVNNRNLKDFSVDFANAQRLRSLIPEDVVYVAESGVKTADDVRTVARLGADAVLVGEALMRAEDKRAALDAFKAAAKEA